MRVSRIRIPFVFLIISALAAIAAACGADDPTATPPPAATPTPAGPSAVELVPVADATLYEDPLGGLANGAGEWIFAGTTRTGAIRRGLIRFDVAAEVPAGADISGVTLTMRVTQTTAGPVEVGLHPVTTPWVEGPTDAFANEGGGAPAEPGDATWLHTGDGDALWTTPGGDFEAAPVVSITVDAEGDTFVWGPSADLTAAVQAWLDDPASNLGWAVIAEEDAERTAKRFESRQNIEGFPEPVFPTLTITYR